MNLPITRIVSGGATGVDSLAELFAKKHDIPLVVHAADWRRFGRRAGPMRNKNIIRDIDILLAFPSEHSVGTLHTIQEAQHNNKNVHVFQLPSPLSYMSIPNETPPKAPE